MDVHIQKPILLHNKKEFIVKSKILPIPKLCFSFIKQGKEYVDPLESDDEEY